MNDDIGDNDLELVAAMRPDTDDLDAHQLARMRSNMLNPTPAYESRLDHSPRSPSWGQRLAVGVASLVTVAAAGFGIIAAGSGGGADGPVDGTEPRAVASPGVGQGEVSPDGPVPPSTVSVTTSPVPPSTTSAGDGESDADADLGEDPASTETSTDTSPNTGGADDGSASDTGNAAVDPEPGAPSTQPAPPATVPASTVPASTVPPFTVPRQGVPGAEAAEAPGEEAQPIATCVAGAAECPGAPQVAPPRSGEQAAMLERMVDFTNRVHASCLSLDALRSELVAELPEPWTVVTADDAMADGTLACASFTVGGTDDPADLTMVVFDVFGFPGSNDVVDQLTAGINPGLGGRCTSGAEALGLVERRARDLGLGTWVIDEAATVTSDGVTTCAYVEHLDIAATTIVMASVHAPGQLAG